LNVCVWEEGGGSTSWTKREAAGDKQPLLGGKKMRGQEAESEKERNKMYT